MTVSKLTKESIPDIQSKIRKVGKAGNALKVVVYGKSGTGKTTFSGTFPKPLLHIVCSSIGVNESIPLSKLDKVFDLELDKSQELIQVPDVVMKNGFKTVVLDHVTGLQDLVLKEIVDLPESQRTWGTVTQSQYGQMTIQMKEILRHLLMLPVNVVVIGQERETVVDEVTGLLTPYVTIAVTPSLGSWLNAAADFILHTYIREQTVRVKTKVGSNTIELEKPTESYVFSAHIGPNPVFVTKVRTSEIKSLPASIDNPSYESLLSLKGKE